MSAELDIEVHETTSLEFQIAVAEHPGATVDEALLFVHNGAEVTAREISGTQGNRIHVLDVGAGILRASYRATVTGNTAPAPVDDYARSLYLRPSRYAEADKFFGFAATEFGSYAPSAQLLEKVAAWAPRIRSSPARACAVTTRI